jgi:hypothetical protein
MKKISGTAPNLADEFQLFSSNYLLKYLHSWFPLNRHFQTLIPLSSFDRRRFFARRVGSAKSDPSEDLD